MESYYYLIFGIIILIVCCVISLISGVSVAGIGYWIYEKIRSFIPPIPWFNTIGREYKPMGCGPDEDEDAGICYPKCPPMYKGVSTTCWPNCPPGYNDTGTQCTKKSYTRGAGKPLTCSDDEDEDAGLCYKKCQDGYDGVGPICYKKCPDGFTDDHLGNCIKPKPYGRGAGYTKKSTCEHHHSDTGCEKYGWLWYPKCKNGYSRKGCCVCSPICPDNMVDGGISCEKKKYGRGVGTPVYTCSSGLEKYNGLCYPKCKDTYKGVSFVCWQECPGDVNPALYGGMFVDTGAQCTKKTKDRGAGKPLHTCPDGWDKVGLFCYGPCKNPRYPHPDGIFCTK